MALTLVLDIPGLESIIKFERVNDQHHRKALLALLPNIRRQDLEYISKSFPSFSRFLNKSLYFTTFTIMPSSKSPSTFTLFPTLPSELRCKIWATACFSRVLSLTYDSSTSSFQTTTPTPTLLSVSREAREEALRVYSLTFGTSTKASNIYFNPYLDTLYLPRYREMGYDDTLRDFRTIVSDPSNVLDEVRSIALDVVSLEVKKPWEGYNKATLLRSFKNLQEVVLVLCSTITQDSTIEPTTKENTQFVEPRDDPEKLLKIWYYFRHSFIVEEKIREDVCQSSGEPYTYFSLPTLKIRSKVSSAARTVDLTSAMDRTTL